MSKLVNAFLNYIRPITKYAWVFLIIIIFIILLIILFKRYAVPAISKSKYKDVANSDQRGLNADIYFFHADWCPHCKKAAPEWAKFQEEYNGKSVNGYVIVTHDVDCTSDSLDTQNQDTANMIKNFNIQGYPTIKLKTDDGKTIDFDSKITSSSLEVFINTVL